MRPRTVNTKDGSGSSFLGREDVAGSTCVAILTCWEREEAGTSFVVVEGGGGKKKFLPMSNREKERFQWFKWICMLMMTNGIIISGRCRCGVWFRCRNERIFAARFWFGDGEMVCICLQWGGARSTSNEKWLISHYGHGADTWVNKPTIMMEMRAMQFWSTSQIG